MTKRGIEHQGLRYQKFLKMGGHSLHPRKSYILIGQVILTCGFLYFLRLPIPHVAEQWLGADFALRNK